MMTTLKKGIPAFKGKRLIQVTLSTWALIFAMAIFRNATVSKDPMVYFIPNFLLFTPFRDATTWCWKKFLVYGKEEIPLIPIPELSASNYSYENLREITDNFKHPGIVRGLFADTVAVKKWAKPGYLEQDLGNFTIPTVRRATYGKAQTDRINMLFRDSWDEILTDKNSMKYLFFPVKSRADKTDELLVEAMKKLALRDLDLDRLWHGFGSETHKTYGGAQIIAGQGGNKEGGKTGTWWHCAPTNNWFVQIAGRKRWYMLDQEYSAYMQPKRNGMFNLGTSAGLELKDLEKFLPIKYTDIEAGDMLYNPNWEWHTIENYEGLSIGVPIRERNITLNFRNNLQYTGYVVINKILDKMGIRYGFDV